MRRHPWADTGDGSGARPLWVSRTMATATPLCAVCECDWRPAARVTMSQQRVPENILIHFCWSDLYQLDARNSRFVLH